MLVLTDAEKKPPGYDTLKLLNHLEDMLRAVSKGLENSLSLADNKAILLNSCPMNSVLMQQMTKKL